MATALNITDLTLMGRKSGRSSSLLSSSKSVNQGDPSWLSQKKRRPLSWGREFKPHLRQGAYLKDKYIK